MLEIERLSSLKPDIHIYVVSVDKEQQLNSESFAFFGEVCCALTEVGDCVCVCVCVCVYMCLCVCVCVCALSSQDCNKLLLINRNVCIMCYAKLMCSVTLLLTYVQF